MSDAIRYEVEAGLAVITVDRPPRNAFDLAALQALWERSNEAADDPAVRAIVLTGASGHFCAGGDVKGFAEAGDDVARHIKELTLYLHGAVAALRRAPKPVLAAVDGVAAGGGFSVALACDLAVASERARFVYAYSAIGLAPDGGGSFTLPRLVGARRALWIAAHNQPIDAREALALGLVNAVYPVEGFERAWREVALGLARGPTRAIAEAKRLFDAAFDQGIETHMEAERQSIAAASQTADHREGVRAFLERRPPRYEGR